MKKIISIVTLIIILSYLLQGIVLALPPDALIQLDATRIIDTNLEIYDGENWSKWQPQYVYYTINGKRYFAYNVIHRINSQEQAGYHDVVSNNLLRQEPTWRIMIHGFPYKTHEEMNVETDEDAYLATKAAVYCITIGRTESIFRGPTEKEEKIISAIKELLKEAWKWDEGQKEATLELEKEGDYEITDDYLVQVCTVSSNVEIADFQINQMTGLPEGSFVANMEGNKQEIFTTEKKFKVMIPKAKIEKGMYGAVSIIAKCNTYPIYYRSK